MGDSSDSPNFQHFVRPEETVELPITPAMAEMLARDAQREKKIYPIIALGSLVFVLLVGIILYVWLPRGLFLAFWLTLALIWVVFAAIGGWEWRNTRRNRRAGTFLRTRGQAEASWKGDSTGGRNYFLRVGKRNFSANLSIYQATVGLLYGTVDYTKYGHAIVELRDSEDRVVYRMPGYLPEIREAGGTPTPI